MLNRLRKLDCSLMVMSDLFGNEHLIYLGLSNTIECHQFRISASQTPGITTNYLGAMTRWHPGSVQPILSQLNTVHILTSYFCLTTLMLSYQLLLCLPPDLLHYDFPIKNLWAFLTCPVRVTCSTYCITLIISSGQCNLSNFFFYMFLLALLLPLSKILILWVNGFQTPSFYGFSVLLSFVGCLVFKEYKDYVRYIYCSQYINQVAPSINLHFSFGVTVIIYE
jgi:hypothetical protein